MSKPFIQIDDLVREMTDEEHAAYLETIANAPQLPEGTDETPSDSVDTAAQ
jgi:hypothetical protein